MRITIFLLAVFLGFKASAQKMSIYAVDPIVTPNRIIYNLDGSGEISIQPVSQTEFRLQGTKVRSLNNFKYDLSFPLSSVFLHLEHTEEQFGELMCYYHLENFYKFAQLQFNLAGKYSPILNELSNAVLNKKIGFTVSGGVEVPASVDYSPINQDLAIQLNFTRRNNSQDGSEDAYEIGRVFFNSIIQEILTDENAEDGQYFDDDGSNNAIADYLTYMTLQEFGIDAGSNTHETIHNWYLHEYNLSIFYDGSIEDFKDLSENEKPQFFATTLRTIADEILGSQLTTKILIKEIQDFNQANTPTIIDASRLFYEKALAENITDDQKCNLFHFLEYIHGYEFNHEADGSEIFEVPKSISGDIFIKDFLNDDNGLEPHTNDAHNSPDVWNRHEPDGVEQHQYVVSSPSQNIPQTENHVHVRLNGDFCSIFSGTAPFSDLELKVYYSVTAFGNVWEEDWNNENVSNYKFGDLIGTFSFYDLKFRDDSGNIITNDVMIYNYGDHVVFSFPWLSPNLFGACGGAITCKVLPGPRSYSFGLLARLECSENGFDPIKNGEGANVHENAQKNNNIALKNTIIGFSESPYTSTTSISIVVNPTPEENFVKLNIKPAHHDPDPSLLDPDDPIRPVFNNFLDIGNVILILDPHYFSQWQLHGAQGSGFEINDDNEIVVTDRGFELIGLPAGQAGEYHAIEVKFQPFDPSSFQRTAIDLSLLRSSDNGLVGSVHVEMREDNAEIENRSFKTIDSPDIEIYPNPTNVDYLNISSSQGIKLYHIVDSQGLQMDAPFIKKNQKIDISKLPSGLYFILFQLENGEMQKLKFVRI